MKFKPHCTPPNHAESKELEPGDVVIAIRHLDPKGANVAPGVIGVVFKEESPPMVKGTEGPLVRWMNLGTCNVYPFDVEFYPDPTTWDKQ